MDTGMSDTFWWTLTCWTCFCGHLYTDMLDTFLWALFCGLRHVGHVFVLSNVMQVHCLQNTFAVYCATTIMR